MKKYILCFIVIAIVVVGFLIGYKLISTKDKNEEDNNTSIGSFEPESEISSPEEESNNKNNEESIDKNSIEYTGWIKTSGAELQNQKGEKIQLKGLSSHGIQWFPDVITYDNLKELKNNWQINVFRLAIYTDPNANGYIAHPEESKAFIKNVVEYAKELDMYIILDWHILSDNNPQTYQAQAIEFFDEMSKTYAETPNVIYEICNEPNGNDVKWNTEVKPYAEELISVIRGNCPNAFIIVGTPDWCKDLETVADNPINASNIAYSCHFYAGTHKEELRDKIDYCISKNIPIFISECGITDASGNGEIFEASFNEWIKYINSNNLSWVFWSFCNKDESSSILRSDYKSSEEINEYLTETGKIIKNLLLK